MAGLAPHQPCRRLNGKRYLPPSPLNGERAGVRGENSPASPLAMYLRSPLHAHERVIRL
jgi:hypothetical protein